MNKSVTKGFVEQPGFIRCFFNKLLNQTNKFNCKNLEFLTAVYIAIRLQCAQYAKVLCLTDTRVGVYTDPLQCKVLYTIVHCLYLLAPFSGISII